MGGGIISERVATSNRNGWRDQLGIRSIGLSAPIGGYATDAEVKGMRPQEAHAALPSQFEQAGCALSLL
jgi:hypothetical protein